VVTALVLRFCDEFSGIVIAAGKNACDLTSDSGISLHFLKIEAHIGNHKAD